MDLSVHLLPQIKIYPQISPEIQVKFAWNSGEIRMKFPWNSGEIRMKFAWNSSEVCMKYDLFGVL